MSGFGFKGASIPFKEATKFTSEYDIFFIYKIYIILYILMSGFGFKGASIPFKEATKFTSEYDIFFLYKIHIILYRLLNSLLS